MGQRWQPGQKWVPRWPITTRLTRAPQREHASPFRAYTCRSLW
jgi:hypothetical protein